jgi:hypothetical protein
MYPILRPLREMRMKENHVCGWPDSMCDTECMENAYRPTDSVNPPGCICRYTHKSDPMCTYEAPVTSKPNVASSEEQRKQAYAAFLMSLDARDVPVSTAVAYQAGWDAAMRRPRPPVETRDVLAEIRALLDQPINHRLIVEQIDQLVNPRGALVETKANPLGKRCYVMSEQHLSGYRLVIGFERREDCDAAHEQIATNAPQRMTAEQLAAQCQALWRTNYTLVCTMPKGHEGDHKADCGWTFNGEVDIRQPAFAVKTSTPQCNGKCSGHSSEFSLSGWLPDPSCPLHGPAVKTFDDSDALRAIEGRLSGIIERDEARGLSTSGLENARRDIEWAARLERSPVDVNGGPDEQRYKTHVEMERQAHEKDAQ